MVDEIVLGRAPEHVLQGKLQFVEDPPASTREERENQGYYVGADLTAQDMADHIAFEAVRPDWLADQWAALNDPVTVALNAGYFGA